ncbi:MAG: polyprenyl synthetase family protein [Candidatus Cloacimonetes bacterium]|jgi:geranylgeranyl pyrophosphate synthase|nr:polyprenyl synthetase family protein [Candidatus Cloacimonadota bacterium]
MKNEVNIWLENIYEFLKKELSLLEVEMKNRLSSVTNNKIDLHNVFNYFFDIRGKRLRPILVLLSAGLVRSINSKGLVEKNTQIENEIQLAAALELIHNSSLIHDDIVDESSHRREQITMNHKFNNKIAVLVGDLIYSHAFLIMNDLKFPRISGILSECVEKMCQSEINEIISPYADFEQYIAYLDAKTAKLMSTCCKCGAIISGANETMISALGEFGTNFGITYQLIDDYLDDEQPQKFDVNLLLQAKIYSGKAKKNLENLEDNEHKKHLMNLIRYVMDKQNLKLKSYQDHCI